MNEIEQLRAELRNWTREAQREALRANRAEDRFIRAEELLRPLGRLPELLRRYNEWRLKHGDDHRKARKGDENRNAHRPQAK